MTPEESKLVIAKAGGPTALAEKLGISSRQRVWNWKKKGIPPGVELENLSLFKRLKREAGLS
jgi:hypothetical protein